MRDQMEAANENCANDDCNAPTPWDMAQIKVDDVAFCSPDCAKEHVESTAATPAQVTLHDPQYAVDRSMFPPSVDEESVSITRRVIGPDDFLTAIVDIEQMFPGQFRVDE